MIVLIVVDDIAIPQKQLQLLFSDNDDPKEQAMCIGKWNLASSPIIYNSN